MGKQLNFYRSEELQAELQAEAVAQSRARGGRTVTHQSVLRRAWDTRPKSLRLASVEKLARDAKAGAKKGGR
jgi:hypothetical protein